MNLNHVNISGLRPIVGDGRKLYIETYGCQMNAGDSEVVLSILQGDGFRYTEDPAGADVILINTCSIRDNAEQRIWGRLRELRQYKKKNKGLLVGVIGCMAERLREKLIDQEELVNLVPVRTLTGPAAPTARGRRGCEGCQCAVVGRGDLCRNLACPAR